MKIIDYIYKEVKRQGFDTQTLPGLMRVVWMLDAWRYAQMAESNGEFFLQTIEELGKMVEPEVNKDGIRQIGVRVGERLCPAPEFIHGYLSDWWRSLDGLSPIEAYKDFEMIHPFVDGNGRVGKIILNWRNHTLHDPIFPPKDLWGKSIKNP